MDNNKSTQWLFTVIINALSVKNHISVVQKTVREV